MQDTPAPSFFAALNAQERAPFHGCARAHLASGLRVASRPTQATRTTRRPALLADLPGGGAVVRLQLAGGRRAVDAGSAGRVGAGVRAASPSDADGVALSASAAAAVGGPCGAGAGELGPADAPVARSRPPSPSMARRCAARARRRKPLPISSQSPPTPRTRRWSRCAWTTRPTRSPWPKTSCPRCPCAAGSSPPTPCRPKPPWLSLSWTRAATTCSRSRTTSRACTPNWRPILPIRRPPAAPPTPWIATGAAPRRARSAPAPG